MFGCGKVKSAGELYGTYVADYKVAREKVILNPDGTFTQEVTIKATSKVDVAKGRWSYDSKSGYVTFDGGFMVVLDGFHQFDPDYRKPKPGVVSEPAGKVLGHLSFGVAEGIIYKKL
ncbi:MAG TPA: hypothetical protein DHU55_06000 [Blastocatellia bacterium]|jgi:hypothetical protein|nr:hypothetical protein [Blastocatellia bacterium]HCX29313.1 hypothetical protein [Blastocatellia bacterium]